MKHMSSKERAKLNAKIEAKSREMHASGKYDVKELQQRLWMWKAVLSEVKGNVLYLQRGLSLDAYQWQIELS